MKLLKKVSLVLLTVVVSLGVVGCANNGDNTSTNQGQAIKVSPDTVIATVNNVEIKQKELDQQLVYLDYLMQWQYGPEYMENEEAMAYYNEQKYILVEYLVDRQVVISRADEMGVEITDEMVEEEVEILKAEYATEEEFNKDLELSEMTLDELKLMIKEDLVFSGVIDPIVVDIEIADGESEEFYQSNIEAFTTPAGAEMSHILLADEDKAIEARTKYDEGKTFEELSTEYGTDETKDMAGLIGYVPYDYKTYPILPFEDEFMESAKALEEGEVSQPIKTSFGWHIVKVENVTREDVVTPFEEMKADIEAKLIADKENEILGEKVSEWRSQCDIDIKEELI